MHKTITIKESWEDIPEYKGLYQVSDTGRIKSLKRKINTGAGYSHIRGERLLSPYKRKDRRIVINLSFDGTTTQVYVHRLVASAFIPNPKGKPCINHIDGRPENNHRSNLEWCTYKENNEHALKNGLMNTARGEKAGKSKLTEQEVIEIRNAEGKVSQAELARKYNVGHTSIRRIHERKNWKHI